MGDPRGLVARYVFPHWVRQGGAASSRPAQRREAALTRPAQWGNTGQPSPFNGARRSRWPPLRGPSRCGCCCRCFCFAAGEPRSGEGAFAPRSGPERGSAARRAPPKAGGRRRAPRTRAAAGNESGARGPARRSRSARRSVPRGVGTAAAGTCSAGPERSGGMAARERGARRVTRAVSRRVTCGHGAGAPPHCTRLRRRADAAQRRSTTTHTECL